jgi:hypothetical protein
MTDDELLIECKKGLNIPVDSTTFDPILNQKLLAVKGYMAGAGVSETVMDSALAIGVIVMGVTDIWNIEGGGVVKNSPVFNTLLGQLVSESSRLKLSSSNPVDGATGVDVAASPTLTFNRRVSRYNITLVDAISLAAINVSFSLDVTEQILTIHPDSDLETATEYAIVISNVMDVSGQTLNFTLIRFTTA